MTTAFTIETVTWQTHQEILRALRTEVFIKEQGISARDEWDDRDDSATHFLAWDPSSSSYIGTARLLDTGKITRMAVLAPFRHRGVGTQLLTAALAKAGEMGHQKVLLDAQASAAPFYRKEGFIVEGNPFIDAGIDHLRMVKNLNQTALDENVHRFEHAHEATAWMQEFAQNARRNIHIFTHTLAPELYCASPLVDAISALARLSAASKVRVLVRDTRPLHGVDHDLVNLARRLPSHIDIKQLTEDIAKPNEGYFCVDESDLVFFNDENTTMGFARRGARAESKHSLDAFEHMWQKCSRHDPNLRLLSL